MAWRTLVISNPSKLSVSQERLKISQEQDQFVPLDDIVCLVIESKQVLITAGLLSRLAEYNVILFSCDEKHLPNGVFSGFHKNSRQTKIALLQVEWNQAFKKRLQQKIIQNKIINQARLLEKIGKKEQAKKLAILVKQVNSGDSKNIEAQAAAFYFKQVFENFTRQQQGCLQNAALNYGYAILRGVLARAVVSSGFLPCLGLFHKSELNAFNLVDDLIEPFRPFVDYFVYKKFGSIVKGIEDFTNDFSDYKKEQHKLLYQLVAFNDKNSAKDKEEKFYLFMP